MSISVARRKRTALYLSIAGLMLIVAALSAISARDPDGVTIRVGMILVAMGATMWLPWQALLPAVIAAWLGPNIGRNYVEDYELFNLNMMLELPGLLALAAVASVARLALQSSRRTSCSAPTMTRSALTRLQAFSRKASCETPWSPSSHARGALAAPLRRARRHR